MRSQRPSIFQVGRVVDDGETVTVCGWGLSLCMSRCSCHQMPDGQLSLATGVDGSLGLVSRRPGCSCCEPWSPYELMAIVADFAAIQDVPEVSA